jgi:hypothetical protein
MVGTFACPECGTEITPRGHAPGRQVRCANCSTLVEVPFFPRSVAKRRGVARDFDWALPWVRAIVAVLVVLIVVLGVVWTIKRTSRKGTEVEFASLISDSEDAERSGRLEQALAKTEIALRLAKDSGAIGSTRFEKLRTRRDALSLRDAESRLALIASEPDHEKALSQLILLLKRAERDAALEPLTTRVRSETAKRAEAELGAVDGAVKEERYNDALLLASRAMEAAASLPPPDGPRIRDDARARASQMIAERGIVLAPVTGKFRLGTAESYREDLRTVFADALRQRGYLPRPIRSPFQSIWEGRAPFRIALEIAAETPIPRHVGAHVGTTIDAKVTLTKGERLLWSRPVRAKSRSSPGGISSLEYGHILAAQTPDPQVEKHLYDDARAQLRDLIGQQLLLIPDPKSAPTERPF